MNQVKDATDFEVPSDKDGQRLDNFLITLLKIPRSLIYKSLRRGCIRLNSGKSKPCARIKSTDIVSVAKHLINSMGTNKTSFFQENPLKLSWLDKCIIFENTDFMVINKPSGLAVHGGSGHKLGLIEMIRALRHDEKATFELVHRLDKDTSGLILISKKRSALRELSSLFANRQIQKKYYAVLSGRLPKKTRCQTPLTTVRCQDSIRRALVDFENGKEAITTFTPHLHLEETTLCHISLKTGRMHQIRAHAKDLNNPIVGDRLYSKKSGVLHLHAFELHFYFKQQSHTYYAPIPRNWSISELLNNKEGPWNQIMTNLPHQS